MLDFNPEVEDDDMGDDMDHVHDDVHDLEGYGDIAEELNFE